MTDRDHFAAADDMVRRALSRKREWEEHGPARWGYGVAVDMLALERRVGALERISAELEYAMGRERERTNHDAAAEATIADTAERSAPMPDPVSAPRDILDEARDFLRPFGSADEVVRYPTAALVLRLADEVREMRGAVAKLRRLRDDAQRNMNRDATAKTWERWKGFVKGIDASIHRLEMHAGE